MSFTETFHQILQFIIGVLTPDELEINRDALPGAEKEIRYREQMRIFFFNLPLALKETFFFNQTTEQNCADLGCERSFGHTQTDYCSTLMLELSAQKTVQSLLDTLLKENLVECGWEGCKGHTKKTTKLETSSFLLIENLNAPAERGTDGNNNGNTMITVVNDVYYLKGLVYKKDGSVVVVEDTEGGAMPAPSKWYYAIYQKTT